MLAHNSRGHTLRSFCHQRWLVLVRCVSCFYHHHHDHHDHHDQRPPPPPQRHLHHQAPMGARACARARKGVRTCAVWLTTLHQQSLPSTCDEVLHWPTACVEYLQTASTSARTHVHTHTHTHTHTTQTHTQTRLQASSKTKCYTMHGTRTHARHTHARTPRTHAPCAVHDFGQFA